MFLSNIYTQLSTKNFQQSSHKTAATFTFFLIFWALIFESPILKHSDEYCKTHMLDFVFQTHGNNLPFAWAKILRRVLISEVEFWMIVQQVRQNYL